MDTFYEPLLQLETFVQAGEKLAGNEGLLLLTGCVESQKTHLMYSLGRGWQVKLILTYSELKAKEIYEEYEALGEEAFYYPAKDFLFFHADIQGNELLKQRMTAVSRLLSGKAAVIVTTLDGCMDPLLPFEKLKELVLTIGTGSILEMEAVKRRLVRMGYERVGQAELPGQFAIRGGILDIYPLTEEYPVRIELWDEEVDSIRSFDAESQRSMENLEEIVLYPAAELNPGEYHMDGVSLLDYVGRYRSLVFLDEVNRLYERGETVEKEYRQNYENRMEKGQIMQGQQEEIFPCEQVMYWLSRMRGAALGTLETTDKRMDFYIRFRLETRSVQSYHNHFELLVKDLKRWKKEQYRIVLMCASRTRGKRLAEELLAEELAAFYSEDEKRVVQPGEIMVVHGNVFRGYEYPMIRFAVISETDVFGREKKKRRRKQRTYEGRKIGSFTDLSIGDYVVHENHGLGIYRGIEKITVDKTVKDYMKIEYSRGACLYILATQLDLIQKYGGADAAKVPRLNTLGGQDWKKTRSKVKGAVQEVAKDLVELYAARQSEKGYVYGPDTVWQKEFEELFPYEETEDQQRAIQDTKKDMESSRIMDRLICGDVGYGKTEIAIRAAFKAVQEGKQVVYLVPTTILAQQHYNGLGPLLEPLGIRCALLTGSTTAKTKKSISAQLAAGELDFIVGTHALITGGVDYADLGLVVTDEQHRFGVAQRAALAAKGRHPHTLVMSATPIPRTLALILYGDLDVSIIDQLPPGRKPVETSRVPGSYHPRVYGFIRKLVDQGRQAYIVCPQVSENDDPGDDRKAVTEYAQTLQKEVFPDLKVAFVHGKMKPKEKDAVMRAFAGHETDILVSTTVIEVGVDVPNAAVMVVENAERFGLSQLHQLRGRVGRGEHQSYCVLISDSRNEETLQRLRVMVKTTDGFKIAEEDLRLRGPGDFFGERQHGLPGLKIADLGVDAQLLQEAQKAAEDLLARDPDLTSCPATAERIAELFAQSAETLN